MTLERRRTGCEIVPFGCRVAHPAEQADHGCQELAGGDAGTNFKTLDFSSEVNQTNAPNS
jgi:hypothetical protein